MAVIHIDASGFFAPTISNATITSIMVKTFLTTIFSPFAIFSMLFFTVGVVYLFGMMLHNNSDSKTGKKQYLKNFFLKNKILIGSLLLVSLLVNVEVNKESMIKDSVDNMVLPSKVCRVIPMKMLDAHMSDNAIMDAMSKSGCNPGSFGTTKFLWSIQPKKTPGWKHTHGQYNLREFGDA
jgi:hypothetical protein